METSIKLAKELIASRHHYIPISLGTSSTKHLFCRFLEALETYRNETDEETADFIAKVRDSIPIQAWISEHHPFWTTREAEDLVQKTLLEALDNIAPNNFYFGVTLNHPYDYHFTSVFDDDDDNQPSEDPYQRQGRLLDSIKTAEDARFNPWHCAYEDMEA